jgi:hypothetical protein
MPKNSIEIVLLVLGLVSVYCSQFLWPFSPLGAYLHGFNDGASMVNPRPIRYMILKRDDTFRPSSRMMDQTRSFIVKIDVLKLAPFQQLGCE